MIGSILGSIFCGARKPSRAAKHGPPMAIWSSNFSFALPCFLSSGSPILFCICYPQKFIGMKDSILTLPTGPDDVEYLWADLGGDYHTLQFSSGNPCVTASRCPVHGEQAFVES